MHDNRSGCGVIACCLYSILSIRQWMLKCLSAKSRGIKSVSGGTDNMHLSVVSSLMMIHCDHLMILKVSSLPLKYPPFSSVCQSKTWRRCHIWLNPPPIDLEKNSWEAYVETYSSPHVVTISDRSVLIVLLITPVSCCNSEQPFYLLSLNS